VKLQRSKDRAQPASASPCALRRGRQRERAGRSQPARRRTGQGEIGFHSPRELIDVLLWLPIEPWQHTHYGSKMNGAGCDSAAGVLTLQPAVAVEWPTHLSTHVEVLMRFPLLVLATVALLRWPPSARPRSPNRPCQSPSRGLALRGVDTQLRFVSVPPTSACRRPIALRTTESADGLLGLVRLFGSDRAFFYAAAFGRTSMSLDKTKSPPTSKTSGGDEV